jgi:addiction module HigA family antidote
MHPGEVLREEFLLPLKLSAGALARNMDVRTRIERIAEEKTGITADTALRLSKALGTSGLTCKRITIWRWPCARSARSWRRSSRQPSRHRHENVPLTGTSRSMNKNTR